MLVLSQTFPCRFALSKQGFVGKILSRDLFKKARENYQSKAKDWDKVRTGLAQKLGLEFQSREKLQS